MRTNKTLKIKIILIFLSLIACNSCLAQTDISTGSHEGWYLLWHDEFEGKVLDESKWRAEDAALTKNNEMQYYTPEDVWLDNGFLVLRSEKRSMGKRMYTSGLVETRNKFVFQYGRVEIRAQVPQGKGLLPAHWMLPATGLWPPEIDIMEVLGHQPNVVHMTAHWGVWPDREKKGEMFMGSDFSQDFHEYAMEWDKDSIKWFVDGKQHLEVDEYVPHEPFYIILNTAVGGDWPGSPNSKTQFPQEHKIDYVRVYVPEIPGKYYLNVMAENGKVDVLPKLTVYPKNKKIKLWARPQIGYKFSTWSGDIKSPKNPLVLSMKEHKQIIANFIPDENAWKKLAAKISKVSSSEAEDLSARYAIDNNLKTRWSSAFSDPQWLQIDLGKKCLIKAVRLNWETAFARAYKIQVSDDAKDWKTIYSTSRGQGAIEEIKDLNAKARYIAIYGITRAREFGYSLWEFEVFGKEL
ncbi:MAG: family 16 glycosylhydrolase [Candidatus Omnitrophica bacterium]|nr:family 16 glycosylhydrolase [Candidatus Omnitrophota bacterium]